MSIKRRMTAGLMCLLLAGLMGCGGETTAAGSGSAAEAGTDDAVVQADENVQSVETFALAYDENDGLDPLSCTSEANQLLTQLCYERLFVLNEDCEPQQELCASVTRNGTKSYTLTLRTGVTFHSGEEMQPEDVVYSLNNARLRDDSTYQEQLSCISSVKYSGDEIYIRLSRAQSERALEALLDVPIFRKGSEDEQIPDGSGPYQIVTGDDGLKAVPFAGWSGGTVGFCDSITLQSVADSAGAANLLGSGDLSMLLQTDAEEAAVSGAKHTQTVRTTRLHYLGINCRNEPLDDAEVRTALSMLLDRDTIAESCFSGRADAASLPAVTIPDGVEAPNYDVDAAVRLLKRAGIYDRDDDGFLDMRGGDAFTLEIIYNKAYSAKGAVLEQYAKSLSEAGIQVTVVPLEFEECQARLINENFQLYYGEYDLTAAYDLSSVIAKNGERNFGRYRNTDMETALSDMNSADDYDAAYETYLTLFAEETPVIPIVFERALISSAVEFPQGFDPWPDQIFHGLGSWSAS